VGTYRIVSADKYWEVDWVIIAAGLGSTALTSTLRQPVDIRPVLGQALQIRLAAPLKSSLSEPVITGEDAHIVPIGGNNYWIGATVEMPNATNQEQVTPNPVALEAVWQQVIALCPVLKTASIQRSWSGLRPRPEGRPAPIVERLTGYSNVLLASGHYRNGVLLAPATAAIVRQIILANP
jgi:glycine/D-amino acid oxidase-like deaminating enzyme